MKKLLITTDCFLPRIDGVSRFLQQVVPVLAKKYEITIIAPRFEGQLNTKGMGIKKLILFSTYKFLLGDIKVAKIKRSVIKKEVMRTDIIWSHTLGPIGLTSIIQGHKYNKLVVSYIHSIEFELFAKAISNSLLEHLIGFTTQKLIKYAYSKCDLLMVPSLEVAEILTWKNISTPKKVVQLGVDINTFKPVTLGKKRALRKEYGIAEGDIVILYVGRLAREKGLRTLLKAFLMLERNFTNVKLIIVGDGREDIKNKFANRKNVILMGVQKEVEKFYQLSDIYVLPSLTETTSLTTLEAMACELAVVVTPVGLIKYYVTNNKNGLLFPKDDYLRLYKNLTKLVTDSTLRARLGYQARLTVKKEYSWSITLKKIDEIFARLTDD